MRIGDWSADVCSPDLTSCGVAAIARIASAPVQAQERVCDVPAQPAIDAIPEFARQAEIQIVAPARDLEGILTPEIKGRMDARAALRRLLAGTPLQIASDSGPVITLRSSRSDRNSVVKGKRVTVSVDLGGRCSIKKTQ